MGQKKTKIFIGILLTLIMFASSLALVMYSKQNELKKQVESQVEVYVSAKDLKEGDSIGAKEIVLKKMPKSYIDFTPLTKEEILGRFAKVVIFANEPLRPEKITLTKVVQEDKKEVATPKAKEEEPAVKRLSSDTVSLSLELFKNLDISLQKDDFIDIVSVSPSKKERDDYEFATTYVALHVKIHSFGSGTKEMQKTVHEEYDEKTKQSRRSVADTLILEMSPLEIKNFLAMYYKTQELNAQKVHSTKENRGHLWMVRCSSDANDTFAKEKEMLLLKEKINKLKVENNPKPPIVHAVKISYEE
jgi:hypothetical protein